MTTCLIGYTGFIGTTLLRSNSYDLKINRANISELGRSNFEQVVCAGLPAEKWKANFEPERDLKNVEVLKLALSKFHAKKFILISTVDVYDLPVECDEDTQDNVSTQPYGRHRLLLEDYVRQKFEQHLIIRLPALFGPGLKKNILYDLLNCNEVEKINSNSVFQWYPTSRLASDMKHLEYICFNGTINLCTEPLPTDELIERCFPKLNIDTPFTPVIKYDVRTKFANLFHQHGLYIESKENSLEQIKTFTQEYES